MVPQLRALVKVPFAQLIKYFPTCSGIHWFIVVFKKPTASLYLHQIKFSP